MSETLRELIYLHIPLPIWWVIGPILAWRVGLRLYRLNARQPYEPSQYRWRAGTLMALTVGVGAVAFKERTAFYALCAGFAAGAVIGLLAIRLTSLRFYAATTSIQPDPLIGAVLSVLLVGRLVYRYFEGSSISPAGWTLADFVRNPSTMVLFGLFTAHYLVFSLGIVGAVRRGRRAA